MFLVPQFKMTQISNFFFFFFFYSIIMKNTHTYTYTQKQTNKQKDKGSNEELIYYRIVYTNLINVNPFISFEIEKFITGFNRF